MSDRKTILLVEDEALIRLSQTRMLEKEGYVVLGAGSGEEALEIAQNGHSIDLILMDIDLGKGMDGTDTAREILKNHNLPYRKRNR
jgi:CheY-like chemotaxis protein